jgi:hypothetical protein
LSKDRKDHTGIELNPIGYASARNAKNRTKLKNYREIIIIQQETTLGIFLLRNHVKEYFREILNVTIKQVTFN